MNEKENVLISLEERHAENILSGRKRVELRRRAMSIDPGCIVWLYVKVPIGCIVGCVTVKAVHHTSPTVLWNTFGEVSGLSRRELYQYFSGKSKGFALELEGAVRMTESLSLDELRTLVSGFQPPQFFTRLSNQNPIYNAVKNRNH